MLIFELYSFSVFFTEHKIESFCKISKEFYQSVRVEILGEIEALDLEDDDKEESKDKDKDQKPKSAATFITETKGEKSPRT